MYVIIQLHTCRHILGDLELGLGALLQSVESDYQCTLVTNNPYQGRTSNPLQAEIVILFDICALAEVGNTKNNLIGVCFVLQIQ